MSINFFLKNKASDLDNNDDKQNLDLKFTKAVELFITQRNNRGITLEDLSKKTMISRNVLIAIENGWKKFLPEKTYLISMIKRLEIELSLERGSLDGLLTHKIINNDKSVFKFKFINIDFLNSRIGSVVYFILMLLSILALNSQQKYLLKINSISTEPIFMRDYNIEKEIKVLIQDKN